MPEIKECFNTKFMPTLKNQFQKASYSQGRFLEFAVLKPKRTLEIGTKYSKVGDNSNYYLTDLKVSSEEFYPEFRKAIWKIARVAHIHYTLRLAAAKMWNEGDNESDDSDQPHMISEPASAGALPESTDGGVIDAEVKPVPNKDQKSKTEDVEAGGEFEL